MKYMYTYISGFLPSNFAIRYMYIRFCSTKVQVYHTYWQRGAPGGSLPNKFGINKTVRARLWPCLEPFLVRESFNPFKLSPPISTAATQIPARVKDLLSRVPTHKFSTLLDFTVLWERQPTPTTSGTPPFPIERD